MDPPLPPESALLATKSRGACSRPFRPGAGERQPRAAPPRKSPWAGRSGRGPLARMAGERCRGGGRRLTARNLRPYGYLNRRRRASLIPPPKDPSVVSREATRDFGMIVRCRGRSSGWLARPRGKPAGRNRARVSCTAGPRSLAGLLGAGTSPQPGLAGINRGPGQLIGCWRPSILYGVERRALPRWPPGARREQASRRVADARRSYFTGSRGSTRMTKFKSMDSTLAKFRVIPGECPVGGSQLMIICPYPFCDASWKRGLGRPVGPCSSDRC